MTRHIGSSALWIGMFFLVAAAPLSAQLTDTDGFINRLLVLGSYNNPEGCDPNVPPVVDPPLVPVDLGHDYIDDGTTNEFNILPVEGMVLGTPTAGSWRVGVGPNKTDVPTVLAMDANDTIFDYNNGVQADNAMSYAFIYVNNLTGRGVPISVNLGSDDSGFARVNYVEALRANACRGVGTRNIENSAPAVTLLPGWNLVTFKVWNGGGGYALVAQLTDGINTNKPIVNDGVNFQFALALPNGESLAVPPAAGAPTRDVTVTNPNADTTMVEVTLHVNSGGQPCTVVEKVPAVFAIEDAGGGQVQPGSLGEASRQWLANGNLPAIITWKEVTDSVSYSFSKKGYFRTIANDNNITGSVAYLNATVASAADNAIGGPLAVGNIVAEMLVTPPIAQTAEVNYSTNAPSYPKLLGKWIDDNAGLTDANIVPSEGLAIAPEFLGASQGTGWITAGNADFNAGTLVKWNAGGTFDWNAIYGGTEIDNSMNVAYFYLVNPDSSPKVFYLDVSTDDATVVRLNGKVVWALGLYSQGNRFSIWADPGKNLVAIYCFQGGGGWTTWARLEEPWYNSAPTAPYVTTDPTGYDPDPAAHPDHGAPPSPYFVRRPSSAGRSHMAQGGCSTTPDMINGPWLVGRDLETATTSPMPPSSPTTRWGCSSTSARPRRWTSCPANVQLSARAEEAFYFEGDPSNGVIKFVSAGAASPGTGTSSGMTSSTPTRTTSAPRWPSTPSTPGTSPCTSTWASAPMTAWACG